MHLIMVARRDAVEIVAFGTIDGWMQPRATEEFFGSCTPLPLARLQYVVVIRL